MRRSPETSRSQTGGMARSGTESGTLAQARNTPGLGSTAYTNPLKTAGETLTPNAPGSRCVFLATQPRCCGSQDNPLADLNGIPVTNPLLSYFRNAEDDYRRASGRPDLSPVDSTLDGYSTTYHEEP